MSFLRDSTAMGRKGRVILSSTVNHVTCLFCQYNPHRSHNILTFIICSGGTEVYRDSIIWPKSRSHKWQVVFKHKDCTKKLCWIIFQTYLAIHPLSGQKGSWRGSVVFTCLLWKHEVLSSDLQTQAESLVWSCMPAISALGMGAGEEDRQKGWDSLACQSR